MAFTHGGHGGGFDLPPLNHAIGDNAYRDLGMTASAPFARPGSAGFPAHTPSRTHSPLAGPGVTPAPGQPYHLPLPVPTHPHGHTYPSPHHFYPSSGGPTPAGPAPPVPSLMDMERHFADLEREKRTLQELLDRTDRMMAGLKRGIDEIRMHQPPPPPPPSAHPPPHHAPSHGPPQFSQPSSTSGSHPASSHPPAEAVPLNRIERSSSTQSRESIWPVNPPEGVKRD